MTEYVEFDRDALEAALRDGLDLNDCDQKDLDKLLLNKESEIIEEFKKKDATLDIAALGGDYKVGSLNIKLVLGNFALLNLIESPLMRELNEGEELKFEDCCEAIYVLFHGKDALTPIMNIQQKIKSMMSLKELVNENPELIDKVLDRVENIAKARDEFTNKAIEFYLENFDENGVQEVVESVINILNDAISSLNVDDTLEETIKKKVSLTTNV